MIGMMDDPEHFRARARQCRELVSKARVPEVAQLLALLAEELDVEATKIAGDGTTKT
jgi:hypothetical protein